MAFHMTTAAAQEILAAARRSDADGMALRVAAKPTPDGPAYGMGFDEAAPDDEVAVFDGLTVLIAPPSRESLAGTVLDFVELDGGARDFIFMPQKSGADTNSQKSGSESKFAPARSAGESAESERSAKLVSDPDFCSGGCSRCG